MSARAWLYAARRMVLAAACVIAAGCDGVTIGEPPPPHPVAPYTAPAPQPHPRPCPDGACPGAIGRIPPADLPPSLREPNYGGGSCAHAAIISILRWQGRADTAEYWRRNFSGAAGVWDLARVAGKMDLDYAWTTTGDPRFLQWCSDTRRGAAIHYKPVHAVAFLGYVESGGASYAVIADNNHPGTLEYIEKSRFISAWQGYGGCALTIVGTPGNPRPVLYTKQSR